MKIELFVFIKQQEKRAYKFDINTAFNISSNYKIVNRPHIPLYGNYSKVIIESFNKNIYILLIGRTILKLLL